MYDALRAHRISRLPNGRIDGDRADTEWAQNTDVMKQRPLGGPQPVPDAPAAAAPTETPAPAVSVSVLHQSRAMRENYNARLAKLEYETKAGMLVSRIETEQKAFRVGRQIREAIESIPSRIAALVAAETNEEAVRKILAMELRLALQGLAGQLRVPEDTESE